MRITFNLDTGYDEEMFKILFTEGVLRIKNVFNQPNEKELSTAFLKKMIIQVMKQTGTDWSGVLEPLDGVLNE